MVVLLLNLALVTVAVNSVGAVTQPTGLTQFWTDDYKVFEQVYGKTSDKDIYGATLPPNVKYGSGNIQLSAALDKNEKVPYDYDTSASGTQVDPGYNENYLKLIAKQQLIEALEKEAATANPTNPSYKFVGYNDFKPISQHTDPETYNYLKNLENFETKEVIGFPQQSLSGFKPYAVKEQEKAEAYKSIQDILVAYEAKKGFKGSKNGNKDESKYFEPAYASKSKNPPIRYLRGNDLSSKSSRCTTSSGRCRKRSSYPPTPNYSAGRSRTRPVLRKIKHTVIDD